MSAGLSLTEVEDWLTAGGDGERPMPEAHRLRKAAEVLGDDGAEILRRYGYVEAASALEKQLETERLRSSKPFWWNENVLRYRGRQLDPEETKAVLEFIDEFRDRPRTSN